MTVTLPGRGALRWAPVFLLATCGAGLAVGGLLRLAGAPLTGQVTWEAVGAVGAAYSLWASIDSLRHRRFGVDVIALLALVGALTFGEHLASSVIAVMLASGRSLEAWAGGKAQRDLSALLERAPKFAHRYTDGSLETIPVHAVEVGDVLMVAGGEVVPADGALATPAVLDESAITGEPLPISRSTGELARSGGVNAGGPFDLRVTVPAAESTYEGIVRLVREAAASQAPMVRMADRYAIWFFVLVLAVSGAAWVLGGGERAVAVLVVATPCPLILAAPVALVSGLSRCARRGVVVKSGAALERLAACTTLLVDKTGTLTAGAPRVARVVPWGDRRPDEVLSLAASVEQASPHVLANSVVTTALSRDCTLRLPSHVREVPGRGIRGVVDGHLVAVGNAGRAPAQAGTCRRLPGSTWAVSWPSSSPSTPPPLECSSSKTRSEPTRPRPWRRCAATASSAS
jgi:cation transport ATPase